MPQEVPSLQTPHSSIRFPAFRQAESSGEMDPDQASESGFPVQMKAGLLVFCGACRDESSMPVAVAGIGDPGPQECASLERTGISDPGYSKSQTGCLHHVA